MDSNNRDFGRTGVLAKVAFENFELYLVLMLSVLLLGLMTVGISL